MDYLLKAICQEKRHIPGNPSEGVKKLYFITVTFQTKLKVFRQGFADYEDGILVSLIRRRNEPFLTEFFEALRPFNAIFLAHHQN
jgi:hypothetical protein